jgi:hypothetical protein
VLFEHGNLKEVVDHESSACGCPPVPVVSVADSGVTSETPAAPGSAVATKSAADQHPFPAAVSAGLAPPPSVPQAPAGVVHAQVSTTLSYGAPAGDGTNPRAATEPAAAPTNGVPQPNSAQAPTESQTTGTAQAPPPPPAPPPADVVHSIGRFFKRLFGGH